MDDYQQRRAVYRKIIRITDKVASGGLTHEVRLYLRRMARAVAKGSYALTTDVQPVDWAVACVNIMTLALSTRPSVLPEMLLPGIAEVLQSFSAPDDDHPDAFGWVVTSCGYHLSKGSSTIDSRRVKKDARLARKSMAGMLRASTHEPGPLFVFEDHVGEEKSEDAYPTSATDFAQRRLEFVRALVRWQTVEEYVGQLSEGIAPGDFEESQLYVAIARRTDAYADLYYWKRREWMRSVAMVLTHFFPEVAEEHEEDTWVRILRTIGLFEFAKAADLNSEDVREIPTEVRVEEMLAAARAWQQFMDALDRRRLLGM